MKRLAAAILLASSLVLTMPVAQAAPAPQSLGDGGTLVQQMEKDLIKGYHFYLITIGEWLQSILQAFANGRKAVGLGDPCDDQSQCPAGLACLNACPSGKNDCDVLIKRCVRGPNQISVIGIYGACDATNVCAKGTSCQRVCPAGATCTITDMCLPEETVGPTCKSSDQCLPGCLAAGLPPVGGLALHASCEAGFCYCHVESITPSDPRVPCPDGQPTYACPKGTVPACTTGGRPTCLLAPEYGGHCLADAECGNVSCPSGLNPFCDADTLCRCRGTKAETVSCTSNSQCAGITCAAGQKQVCQAGSCSCALTTTPSSCMSDNECSAANCPSGYAAACVNSKCACQRTVEAPVTCTDVSQCGAISCPTDFNKACVNNQCACTRTRTL